MKQYRMEDIAAVRRSMQQEQADRLTRFEDMTKRPVTEPHSHVCGFCGQRVACDFRERQWFCGSVTNWDVCPDCRAKTPDELMAFVAERRKHVRTDNGERRPDHSRRDGRTDAHRTRQT